MRLYRAADDLREKAATATDRNEHTRLLEEQIKAFRAALEALRTYNHHHPVAASSDEDLRFLFRVGVCNEFSGNLQDALSFYRRCEQHPKKDSLEWAGAPFAAVLNAQLQQVESRLGLARPAASGEDWWVAESITKGEFVPKPATPILRSERPSPETIVNMELARLFGSSDLDGARALGESLLNRHPSLESELTAKQRNGISVFAIGTATQAEAVLGFLSSERQQITRDLGIESASLPMLIVYANFVDDKAEELAHAVHNRDARQLEAYYSPVDNAIVLLRHMHESHLGTASHELVHSLIHSDFPMAAFWLDEGLASLYEEMDSSGMPLDNYRLYYVHAAQAHNSLPKLSELLQVTGTCKYHLYAAEARYLLFYIRSKFGADKMRAVYQACRLASADGNFECRPAIASTLGSRWEKLESEFAKFIKRRSESEANRRWGILRSDAYSAIDRMLAEKPCN